MKLKIAPTTKDRQEDVDEWQRIFGQSKEEVALDNAHYWIRCCEENNKQDNSRAIVAREFIRIRNELIQLKEKLNKEFDYGNS